MREGRPERRKREAGESAERARVKSLQAGQSTVLTSKHYEDGQNLALPGAT